MIARWLGVQIAYRVWSSNGDVELITLPVGVVDQPAKSYPLRVSGPVFPGSAYAFPPVVNDPSAGSEPVPPLALKEITCVVGIHFALSVTDAVGV